MSEIRNIFMWKPKDLDEILWLGNALYGSMSRAGIIQSESGYVAIDELPKKHVLCNMPITIEYGEIFRGCVGIDQYDEELRDNISR